jgi:hypothetical protein
VRASRHFFDKHAELRKILGEEVVVIAWRDGPTGSPIRIQDFYRDGQSYIPVFTSIEEARDEMEGLPDADRLVAIRTDVLLSLLDEGQALVFNPQDGFDLKLTVTEVRQLVGDPSPPN